MKEGYEISGCYLVRAPLLPASLFHRALAELGERPEPGDDELHDLLCRLHSWRRYPLVEQALTVATGSLVAALERLAIDETTNDVKKVQRVRAPMLRYLIRMCTRPTPFGLFAGVALGHFGAQATLRLGGSALATVSARVDKGWMARLLDTFEGDERLRQRMTVRPHPAILVAAGRILLNYEGIRHGRKVQLISTPANEVVQQAIHSARDGASQAEVAHHLVTENVVEDEDTALSVIDQLLRNGFLLGDLRPSPSAARPERDLISQLRRTGCFTPVADDLAEIAREIDTLNVTAPGSHTVDLGRLTRRMNVLTGTDPESPALHLDARLDLRAACLPSSVASTVAKAASTVASLTPPDYHGPHLREYRSLFVQRYGSRSEVGILELLSPELGLGPPRSYGHSQYNTAQLQPTFADHEQYDRLVVAELIRVLRTGGDEMTLTDELVSRLGGTSDGRVLPPLPSMDVFFEVAAMSSADIDSGHWRCILTHPPTPWAGRALGRFVHLLGSQAETQLRSHTHDDEKMLPEVAFAEVSYEPTDPRAANVMVAPQTREFEIPVNVTPGKPAHNVIALDDLVVGIRNGRFTLRSRRLDRYVVATQTSMLNLTTIPNVCRFLLEVSLDQWRNVGGFSWGPAEGSPFLPRVTYDDIVLRVAEWNVTTDLLGDMASRAPDKPPGELREAIHRWRRDLRVPRWTYLVQAGNRLLLDLDHPASRSELERAVRQVGATGVVTVQEMMPDFDQLWLRDGSDRPYVAEFVAPVRSRSTNVAAWSHHSASQADQHPLRFTDKRKWPGSDWIHLKMYLPRHHQDRFILTELSELVTRLQDSRRVGTWFFVRYTDPAPHIRVRLHVATHGTEPTVLRDVMSAAAVLVDRRVLNDLALVPYDRETERYGGMAAIEQFEALFHADSELVVRLLRDASFTATMADRLAVATRTVDWIATAWGLSLPQRLTLAQTNQQTGDSGASFRSSSARLQRYFGTAELDHLLAAMMPNVVAAHERLLAVRGVSDNVASEQETLASVLHMHMNRLGLDRQQEATVFGMWRRVLRQLRHQQGSGPFGTDR